MGSFKLSPHTHLHKIIFQLFHKAASSGNDYMSVSEVWYLLESSRTLLTVRVVAVLTDFSTLLALLYKISFLFSDSKTTWIAFAVYDLYWQSSAHKSYKFTSLWAHRTAKRRAMESRAFAGREVSRSLICWACRSPSVPSSSSDSSCNCQGSVSQRKCEQRTSVTAETCQSKWSCIQPSKTTRSFVVILVAYTVSEIDCVAEQCPSNNWHWSFSFLNFFGSLYKCSLSLGQKGIIPGFQIDEWKQIDIKWLIKGHTANIAVAEFCLLL